MRKLSRVICPDIPAGNYEFQPSVFAFGFSLRKRSIVRRFAGDVKVHFISHVEHVLPGSTLLLWGSDPVPPGLAPDIRIVRLEDGFLRSVGLGADLTSPLSWVFDNKGIYYDATRPSDLECLLQSVEFFPDLLDRAARLRKRIVENGLTKYNIGTGGWRRPEKSYHDASDKGGYKSSQGVILVPGQVETDASIRFGAPGIGTNMDLLRKVREANPDAYVVYKPHPDVVAGLRAGGKKDGDAPLWCDEVVSNGAMGQMLKEIDEVHVLTSLTGFEALLRGKPVTCYGLPFYAGWGLTKDIVPILRRTRRLSLDMLVAGALILYPTYISRETGTVITTECALDELLKWREAEASRISWWREAYRSSARNFLRRP